MAASLNPNDLGARIQFSDFHGLEDSDGILPTAQDQERRLECLDQRFRVVVNAPQILDIKPPIRSLFGA